MYKAIFSAVLICLISAPLLAADGLITVKSEFSVKETADRLESILNNRGMTIFNRIDHATAAGKIGVNLRHTELVIFGNPRVGSPLMKCGQSVAIDLPQKALIREDDKGNVWISYNDPGYLKKRHHISGCDGVFKKIEKALNGIINAAARK